MTVRIIKRKYGVYDCYEEPSWVNFCSRISPDNIFSALSKLGSVNIIFVDEELEEARKNAEHRKTASD